MGTLKYKRVPITFKGCSSIGTDKKVPQVVKDIITRQHKQKNEASSKIRFVLMANNGLNSAQIEALREAVTILESK